MGGRGGGDEMIAGEVLAEIDSRFTCNDLEQDTGCLIEQLSW